MNKLRVALTGFVAISAFAGGCALLLAPNGGGLAPLSLIDHTPFTSFVVPGLILTLIVAGSSALCCVLALRRSRYAVDATILAGGTLLVWILAEAALMRAVHWLHMLYGTIGFIVLYLGVREAWRSRAPRYRWVVSVTIAETLGFFVPACAGVISAALGASDLVQALVVVAAGFAEGLALGLGQALVFPLPLRRMRYALLSSLGAGIVWASVMSMTMLFGRGLPAAVITLAALTVAIVGLLAIGTTQWIELRRYVARSHRWIVWTALAWLVALPLSFTPTPFVDESTPIAANLLLWACGGLLMALAMALVTWQGVRRLLPEAVNYPRST